MNKLSIMPVGKVQSTDIRDEHKFGYFRICASYKDPNHKKGYDKFPDFATIKFGGNPSFWNYHLIVQLRGCPLKCPYCYVDDEGIEGLTPINLTPEELVLKAKKILNDDNRLNVFHLMGGAPGLYIRFWSEILDVMNKVNLNKVLFHSDIILVEPEIVNSFYLNLKKIKNFKNHLIAVCVKGITDENLIENTGIKNLKYYKYFENLNNVISTGINYYITLINPDVKELPNFLDSLIKNWGANIINKIQILQIKPYNVTQLRFKSIYKNANNILEKLDNNFEIAYNILNSYSARSRHVLNKSKIVHANSLHLDRTALH